MSWAKLDDRANEHRKQLAAGAEACWLWACGLMYANRQTARDGFIPEQMLPMLYPLPPGKRGKLVAKLLDVGLWEAAPGGYQIHDFTDWNRTKEQVETEREATRNRVAKHRANAVTQQPSNAVTETVGNAAGNSHVPDHSASAPLPLPSHADHYQSAAAAAGSEFQEPVENRSRATPCPMDLPEKLEALGVHLELAQHLKVDPECVSHELRQFRDTWVVGKLAGQSRAHWAGKARQWVIDQASQNKLTAPGSPERESETRLRLARGHRQPTLTDHSDLEKHLATIGATIV